MLQYWIRFFNRLSFSRQPFLWLSTLLCSVLCSLLLLVFPKKEHINPLDVGIETAVLVLFVGFLVTAQRVRTDRRTYRSMMIGFLLLITSGATNVMDEVVELNFYMSVVLENVTVIFALLFIINAFLTWTKRFEELISRLEYESVTDPLTGAFNRRYIDRLLNDMFESGNAHSDATEIRGLNLAMLVVDLDNFKQINDRYGHDVGDDVLKKTVAQMRSVLRTDDYLARTGGEEFEVILLHASLDEARITADRIRKSIAEADFPAVGTVTCSIGLAASQVGDSLITLRRRADTAMYSAKRSGKNQVVTC